MGWGLPGAVGLELDRMHWLPRRNTGSSDAADTIMRVKVCVTDVEIYLSLLSFKSSLIIFFSLCLHRFALPLSHPLDPAALAAVSLRAGVPTHTPRCRHQHNSG